MKILTFIKNIILDALFPIKCFGCQKENEIICQKCILNIKEAERETERKIMAYFDYRNPIIKNIIWAMKYHKYSYLGYKLGELLYERFLEEICDLRMYSQGQPIYIIPVPSSPKRKKFRGYNQAESIARGFIKKESKIFKLRKDIVIKKFETLPQARITNRKRRLENIKGAFQIIDKGLIKNKICIVIDDVTTTGGTMSEIIKILEKGGAIKVIGLAVAH